jgi:thiol-disulfide isomerase/thioredoxin
MRVIITCILLLAIQATSLHADDKESAAWEALQDQSARLTEDMPDGEAEGKKVLAERLATQSKDFEKFIADFPASPNRWEARMALLQILNSVAMLNDKEPDLAGQAEDLKAIADDPEAPENIRADAGLVLLQLASVEFDRDRTEASARKLGTAVAKFLETHPDDARAPALRLTEAQALEAFDPARARTLYEEVAKNEDPEISDAAKSGLEVMDLREKPLELNFTAVDGRKVDLSTLRGKVVLIDFWATWCPPCVEEAPALAAAFEKFHGQGFEIVGISLDEDKADLEKFTAENKMPWPQFFDGKGWENELAQRFKIQSVPTMWLLNREGKLVDPAPRGRLEEAIAAALAAKP